MPESVQQLAAHVLAADLANRADALRRLVRAGDPANALAALGPGGARVVLEYIARLPEPVSAIVVRHGLARLTDATVPLNTRLAAAGKLLTDADPATTAAVVQPLLVGLSGPDRLTRLLALQRRVDRCEPLDRLVQKAEAETLQTCPKCQTAFTRPGLIAHLWDEHRWLYTDGKPADPRPMVEAAIAAAGNDPTGGATDAAYLLSRHVYPEAAPALVFQALARGSADPTQTDELMARAAEAHCGVCPVCLTAVPDPLPPLPPPADVCHGRVSADGFTVAVEDTGVGRTVSLSTPAGPREPPDIAWLPPALAATLYTLPVFAVGLLIVLVLPARTAHPLVTSGLALLAGWTTYVFVRSDRADFPDPTDAAVGLAWNELVPGVGRSPAAVRFLTRLCRGSIGHGDPGLRAGRVHELAEQAAVLDRKGETYSQLAATAAVLRASDAARIGREPVATLVDVFRPFAQGRASAGFAEAAAETVLADLGLPSDDLLRLGIGVVAVLFDAGHTPPDLLLIIRFCPWLKKLLPAGHPDHLAGLFAIWQLSAGRGWAAVTPATTVFDLAANAPAAARRLLSAHPDALLRLDLGDAASEAVGAVVLTSRGIAVGGLLTDDPDDRIEAVKTPSGWRLLLGGGLLVAEAPVPARLPDQLRDWLIWRAGRLLPRADQSLERRPRRAAHDMLAAVVADCPLCGVRCAWRAGRLGTMWQAVTGT